MSEPCASCGQPLEAGESFCEACGARRGETGAAAAPVAAATAAPPEVPPAVEAPESPCQRCGAAASEITADGYCGQCGMKQPDPSDHRETDLGGCAAVSDRGHRHHRNEDAYAIDARDGVTVAVVCDGVSQSSTPEKASAAAADAALSELRRVFDAPIDAQTTSALLSVAVARAQEATAALAAPTDSLTPASTFVAAVVTAGTVTVASVGDSRAYWLGSVEQGGQALTVDDSLAEEAIAAGTAPAEAYAAADAHTITAWLGGDADAVVPRLTTAEIPHTGLVLLCSDGLWNHYEEASQLIELVEQDIDRSPIAIARRMVTAALDAGGEDNITVAVIPAGPAASIPIPEESSADGDVHA